MTTRDTTPKTPPRRLHPDRATRQDRAYAGTAMFLAVVFGIGYALTWGLDCVAQDRLNSPAPNMQTLGGHNEGLESAP